MYVVIVDKIITKISHINIIIINKKEISMPFGRNKKFSSYHARRKRRKYYNASSTEDYIVNNTNLLHVLQNNILEMMNMEQIMYLLTIQLL